MRLVSARSWALVVLSAILQIGMFPVAGPLPYWRSELCWVALAPLLLALLLPDRRGVPLGGRNAALVGYACGVLWYLGNCYWIEQTMHLYGGLPEPVAVFILLLFSLYLGLYHALFAFMFAHVRRAAGAPTALLCMPAMWVAVELARARITGFPWDLLGYSQVDNLLLTRLAPVAGVMAISFVVAAVNAAIAMLALGRRRRSYGICGAAVLLAVCVAIFGRPAGSPLLNASTRWAVLMQDNLEVGAVGKTVRPLSLPEELSTFANLSLHPGVGAEITKPPASESRFRIPVGLHADVLVWPEAPSHFVTIDPYFVGAMASLARSADTPIIAGAIGVDRDASAPRGYFEFDSAALFDSTGNYRARYDKIHLVPWGEYVPYKQFFGFAKKLTEGVGDMDRGHERTVFSTGGHQYGVFVCYESIFGDEVREFARNGAEVLVNISDDGWYGDSGAPWQHLNMARMRAIENHRWVLRSTNTGVTTAIDPQGRMDMQAPRHVRAAFAFPFDFTGGTTFYTRHGDWFAYLCVFVTLCALVSASVRRGRTGDKFALK